MTRVLALVLTATLMVQSVPPVSAQEIDAWLAEAGRLLKNSKADEARAVFERALEAARRLALEHRQAAALCGIAESLSARADFSGARSLALQCLELYERLSAPRGIGQANLLLNVAAELSGNWSEAETRARKAIDAFESVGDLGGRGRATGNLLRVAKMDPAEADRLTARAVNDARTTNDRRLEASVLHGWADGLFAGGRYEEAWETLERAATLYEDVGDRVALGRVFNSMGRLYRAHGQLAEALKYQLRALDLHQIAGDPLSVLQSLNAVAVVHGFMGHVKASREFYERALVIAEQSSSLRIQDLVRANLAAQLGAQGEFQRAARTLEEVISHGVDSYPSLRQAQLSWVRLQLGQPREALAAANRAVALCGSAVSDCVSALRNRAAALAATGDRSAALADVTDALNRLEDIRKRLVPADFFKQEFHRAQEGIYSQAIALHLDEQQGGRALETAELARSRAFLDLLAARSVAAAAGEPFVSGGSTPPGGRADLRSMGSAQPAVVRDIARSAGRLGSTFLVYWVADDAVVTWVVTADGRVQSRRTRVLRSKLDDLVRATLTLQDGGSGAAMSSASAGRELYDILIQPVRDVLPRVSGSLITVVPHGPLLSLSFAALRDARGRYLLEDFTLHYAPAASIFPFTSTMKPASGSAGQLLLVADPVLPPRSRLDQPLPRLPGARTEVEAIARFVPRARSTVLRDGQATESSVRAAAAGKAVLHFATHAIVRDDDPFGSFLALGSAPGGADADGVLTAQEVYGWHLTANLVVLSACRSGGGRVTGDGVATFARAFIVAGTPSLIASMWDVADRPANRLLPDFYRAWFAGQSKARALRAAQLQLLRDLRAGLVQIGTPAGLVTLPEHPVLWAGFVLIGEPE
jgi:CHAT domain-containing protein